MFKTRKQPLPHILQREIKIERELTLKESMGGKVKGAQQITDREGYSVCVK